MRQRIKRAIARLITAIHFHQKPKQTPKTREPEPLDLLDVPNPTPEQIETFFENLDFEMLEWQTGRLSCKMA